MTSSPIMPKEKTNETISSPILTRDAIESVFGVVAEKKDAGTAFFMSEDGSKNDIYHGKPTLPKVDKPRPHVCGTCQRCFARLEHLKRHERSHTKEKPFECSECLRCFARRDLLLRHQQKLHLTITTSSRPRNCRDTTTSNIPVPAAAGSGRVRKNSQANGYGTVSGRPRSKTISHVEGALMTAMNPPATMRQENPRTHNRHSSLIGIPNRFEYQQLPAIPSAVCQRTSNNCLPKLETENFAGIDYENGIRTAPLMSGFNYDFNCDEYMMAPNSTINPNALHYSDAPCPMIFDNLSPYQPNLDENRHPPDDSFDWMNGFDHHLSFHDQNEHGDLVYDQK